MNRSREELLEVCDKLIVGASLNKADLLALQKHLPVVLGLGTTSAERIENAHIIKYENSDEDESPHCNMMCGRCMDQMDETSSDDSDSSDTVAKDIPTNCLWPFRSVYMSYIPHNVISNAIIRIMVALNEHETGNFTEFSEHVLGRIPGTLTFCYSKSIGYMIKEHHWDTRWRCTSKGMWHLLNIIIGEMPEKDRAHVRTAVIRDELVCVSSIKKE